LKCKVKESKTAYILAWIFNLCKTIREKRRVVNTILSTTNVNAFLQSSRNHKEFRTWTTKYWTTQDKSAGTTATNFLRLALTRKVDVSRALLRLTLSSRKTLNAAARRSRSLEHSNSPTLDRTLNEVRYRGAFVPLARKRNYGKLQNFCRPEIRKVCYKKIDMPREDISCEREIEQVM